MSEIATYKVKEGSVIEHENKVYFGGERVDLTDVFAEFHQGSIEKLPTEITDIALPTTSDEGEPDEEEEEEDDDDG